MTRETKIGLLVGLAFIIVIGILLSDHLTSSTEPPLATLVGAGANVRQTTTVPGGTQAPITPDVHAPQVQPQATVPTRRDLQQPTNATSIVQVGGPTAPQQQQQISPLTDQPPAVQTQPPTHQTEAAPPPITIVGNDYPTQQSQQPDQQVAGADAPPQ